jgi:PBSX family phage terminase large subunit
MITAETITAPFIPYPWQVSPWKDKSPTLLLTGSSNGGKSQLAAEKIHGFMLHYPGSCALIMRKARQWCTGSVVTMLQSVIGHDPRVTWKSSAGEFIYNNGSLIYTAGMADKDQREALRSKRGKFGEPDIAWLEEANAFSRQDYEEVFIRVRGKRAKWTQVILTTNPDAPTHWIYTDLIQGGGASVYYSNIHDNPRATIADFARLDMLTGAMRLRMRDGKWAQAEGAIYDEWDPSIHMIDADKCPPFKRRFRVVDFGFTNPFVCQWWGEDYDGRLYRYREIYKTQTLVEDHTRRIIELTGSEKIDSTIADHDAEDRATMAKHGVSTVPAVKDVSPGIQEVKARLKVQGDGKPRIFFVRGALVDIDPLLQAAKLPTCTEEEMPSYAWQKSTDGKPAKEEPIKLNDHGCDGTRYISLYLFRRSGGWVRGAG